MKFMLMMPCTIAGMKTFGAWPKEDLMAHIAFMIDLNKQLTASGNLVSAEGLAGPDQAKLVRSGPNGEPVTDGVYPESKEYLAGYWIVDVETPEQAYAIAARASAAPGHGGKPMSIPIEVREIMSGPPPDLI